MSTEQLQDIDYQYPKHGKFRWLTAIFILFFLTLFSYFPISYKIKAMIKKQLSSIPGCPMDYVDIKTEFFLPKFIIKDLTLPCRCFGKRAGTPLKLEEVFLHIRGLSFSPFGPHFMLETKVLDNNISAYITTGMSGIALNIRENLIDAKVINKFVTQIKLSGKIKVDAHVEMGQKGLKEFKLNLRSNNLVIPPQKVAGLTLYTLKLNDLLVQAVLEDRKLKIKDIIIGDANSPVRANYKGHINVSSGNFTNSTIDLKGEIKLSNKFIEDYSLLKFVLTKFDKKDDFYQINFKGPLLRPVPSSK